MIDLKTVELSFENFYYSFAVMLSQYQSEVFKNFFAHYTQMLDDGCFLFILRIKFSQFCKTSFAIFIHMSSVIF